MICRAKGKSRGSPARQAGAFGYGPGACLASPDAGQGLLYTYTNTCTRACGDECDDERRVLPAQGKEPLYTVCGGLVFPRAKPYNSRMENLNDTHRALALFSGGLDSILAARLVAEQGVAVSCLHFFSPFFGNPGKVRHWEKAYGLNIRAIDIGESFTEMLVQRPAHGFGSVLNPCVDCKILMLRKAKAILDEEGACCIISGEVLGQRPMSQRRDSLNVIRRDAGVRGILLRPLCALHLEPTEAEEAGIIDRSRLLGFSGRSRKPQMALAKHFGITEIPTPAGGCRLAEQENARSYWPVLQHMSHPAASDFYLANTGRQFWHFTGGQAFWLTIGRKQADNDAIMSLAREEDLLFKARDFPGPVALARLAAGNWPAELIRSAASLVASYSPKAVRHCEESGSSAAMRVHPGSLDAQGYELSVIPARDESGTWAEYPWPLAREGIKAEAREAERR